MGKGLVFYEFGTDFLCLIWMNFSLKRDSVVSFIVYTTQKSSAWWGVFLENQ